MKEQSIYIQVMPDYQIEGRQTITTGANRVKTQLVELSLELVEKMKNQVKEISRNLSDTLVADEMELEFSFGVTGSGNICILSGDSSVGIKVVLKWNKNGNGEG